MAYQEQVFGKYSPTEKNTLICSQIAETNWLHHSETNVAYERWGVNLFGFNFSFCLCFLGDVI